MLKYRNIGVWTQDTIVRGHRYHSQIQYRKTAFSCARSTGETTMANGFTRFFKGIWYTLSGKAHE